MEINERCLYVEFYIFHRYIRGNFLSNCDTKFEEEKVAIISESILKAVTYCHAQNIHS